MLMQVASDTTKHSEQILVSNDKIEFQFEYADIKKMNMEHLVGTQVEGMCYGYEFEIEPKFGKPLLTLNSYLKEILRQATWLIGRYSYNLIKVKKPEKETDEEKNYK